MDDLKGRCIVEYHGAELFPQRWFDFVFVLRCNNTVLYDRLAARNYSDKKIRTNIECEIFEVLLEEARESYDEKIVYELQNETPEDLSKNLEFICNLVSQWKTEE
ncbi:unnamed protein product [Gongylonema pulchrum]|uniref:Adenylate kinase n=1 Tax=Gongylonema pulchrum TaxID=637853 RepID=A0A183EW18_9BILA|nr:unnamed protein product [Gongylonema pulchrum]